MTAPSRYSCKEVVEKLDEYVDRALTAEEIASVEEHLQRCAECACEYRFESNLISEIRAKLRRIDLPPDLMSRISQMIREECDKEGE